MSEQLSIENLSVSYGKRRVIDKLSVPCMRAGEVTALLGPNGSGKSTLLRALAGLQGGDGLVRLRDRPLSRQRGEVAYLPQTLPPCVHLTVFESLMVAGQATAAGLFRRHDDQQVFALLQSLGIDHLALHFLDQLSGGQRQLVGIAQALIREPAVLLLDEPLSALDLNYQFHVMDLLRRETRRRGMVQGMDDDGLGGKIIKAEVPLAEMFGYSTDLRSATQGRATYSMEFKHYSEAPKHVAEAVMAARK
ncbi:hypothetical protein O166_18095 [Pseudogulbenkiania ferrooxidans EGD-HP2]|uniref:ABC transporter domain-containing protein n=2 Tax=Pseudogulbenkiania ferrooxidans TaxID=549169 RepID=A0ABN0ND16_9NEIS|nr:hypothetical protein O166_18095 [Pseudogulbenkiania ferrooxidans EGD-HP2]